VRKQGRDESLAMLLWRVVWVVPNQSIIQHYDPQNRKRSGRNVGFMSDTETFEPVNGRLVPMQVVSDYADAQKFEQVIEKRSDSLSLCLYCV